ncbi:S-layer homology domain-containing protein [Paenibacillus oryzisoli]|uniref:S-layer homology domain-containing protein n=1 Tax=Paenibacillus oryzisoli TaxID=1850517 RepID=UPI003D296431
MKGNGDEGEPAVAKVNIQSGGQYRLWVRDRDYATNQPGTRTFQTSVDGQRLSRTFGAHGQEGFRWSDGGVFSLDAGMHELALHDTSGFYARCEGFFLTKDLSLVPPENLDELRQLAEPEDPFSFLPDANFPQWALAADMAAEETAVIENEKFKIVFYRGQGENGPLVQNEIFIHEEGQWVQVKTRTEELGFLMMAASGSELVGQTGEFAQFKQELKVGEDTVNMVVDDFFRTGMPVWFIPSGFEQASPSRIDLQFPNTEADLKVSIEFDDLSDDPKVTLDAEFEEDGAYSFLLFNGNETAYEDYETVTAPLLYVKKTVPESPAVIPEAYLFTPMGTLHYAEGNERFQGKEMTAGIVMDPTSVPQDFAYPDTSSFGLVLRGPEGNVRPQFTAPMFGTEHSLFEAGDRYAVSYRILYKQGSWYDTFRHVSEDLFQVRDLRTNYFHSLNEAIYNATDLMMDDDYGGWDPVNMAHYNMEEQDMTTLSNGMSALQRYLLTEDESILERRAVPTLAFMLSRLKQHFKITDSKGGASYSSVLPTPIGGPVQFYPAHVYGGLYEMTQGRMPFLLDHALDVSSQQANLTGIADQASLYKYTDDPQYLDNLVELADRYLANNPNTGVNRETQFLGSFIFSDYTLMVTAFIAAYEATGEQRYLDAAEQSAQLLLTGLWNTGYHDQYAETDYTVTQEKTGPRLLNAEKYSFWWHGDKQWRLGNVDGEAKPAQELDLPLETETAPGWLGARVGMGTEHMVTPGHGNVITMNNWAGMLSKLSAYTGDPFFYTMARNAMIGRFGNYPGYYQDRIIFHQMKENYPYTGPDYTSIYWHHIPIFISMLEDFLINSTWVKSEQHISFPSLYQSGYAYFASNQYGHAPGTFYDEEGMWLWLDRDIIVPDSKEINYIAARKDGVLGLALMNEGNEPLQTSVHLGHKANPDYTGMATVYDADGSTSTVSIVNGSFLIDIPAKGIKSVVIKQLTGVRTPAFANPDFDYSNYTEGNTSEHIRGKGHVIQVAPDHYYAYVYVSDMNSTTQKVTLNYTIGDVSYTKEKVGYPYEFLIKVDNPGEIFRYEISAEKTSGSIEALGGGELKPYDFAHPGITEKAKELGPNLELDTKALRSGMSPSTGTLRFVVPVEDFYPMLPAADGLKGMNITGTLTNKTDGSVKRLISEIVSSEVNAGVDTGTLTLVVKPTVSVPLAAYTDHDVRLAVTVPGNRVLAYNPLPVTVTLAGMASSRNEIRLVVSQSDFPQPLTENQLSGLKISGTLTSQSDQSVLQLDSVIRGNEIRSNGTTVLVVEPTPEVPLKEYKYYDFDIAVEYPAFWSPLPINEPVDATVSQAGMSPSQKVLRLVVPNAELPFDPANDSLNGLRVAGEIRNRSTGEVLGLNSFILDTEAASGNRTILVIPPTSTVPLKEYKVADYEITLTVYPHVAGAWNQKAGRSGDWKYELNAAKDAATIVGYTGLGNVVIPDTLAGYPVTAIGASAFQNKEIKSVSIPDSVATVGHSAFRGNQLTDVTIPAGVERLDDASFRYNKLEHVVVAGMETAFDRMPFALNAAGLTIYGYPGSTAEQHAEIHQYPFTVILPVEPILQPDGMERWTKTATVDVTAANGGTAIAGVWSQTEETPGDSEEWTVLSPGEQFELAGADGIWYLHVRAEDAAGLRYHKRSQPFRLDNTPPDLTVDTLLDNGEVYGGEWTAHTVVASVYATDGASGLTSIQVSEDGGESWLTLDNEGIFPLEESGYYPLLFRASDELGNMTEVRRTVRISKSGLKLTASLTADNGSAYVPGEWSRLPVTASVYAENRFGSTVTSVTYVIDGQDIWHTYETPLLIAREGISTLWFRVEDETGEWLAEPFEIRLDMISPIIEFQPDGAEAEGTTASTRILVRDDGSGVDEASLAYVWMAAEAEPGNDAEWKNFGISDEIALHGAEGDWYLFVHATDSAGNETVMRSNRFRLYTPDIETPPVSSPEDMEVPEPEGNGGKGEDKESVDGKPADVEELAETSKALVFTDVAGHWSEAVIKELAAKGIIRGYPDGSMRPDQSMTRAEFISLLVRVLGVEPGENAEFADMTGHWASPEVDAARRLGWIDGTSEGSFSPDAWITREQMTVFLTRAVQLLATYNRSATFGDMDSVAPWAREAVSAAAESGIIGGYPDGSFRPEQPATRAEATAVLVRILRLPGVPAA